MEISSVYPFDKDVTDTRDTVGARPFSTYNSIDARQRPVYAVVAMARDRAIGRNGDMPWHISADLRHFKAVTMGHPVIMGRATWESLPKRPLPGRLNIVVTSNPGYEAPGAVTALSPQHALSLVPNGQIPFVIGGGRLYREMLPMVSKLFLTLVDADFPDADTRFPAINPDDWTETDRHPSETDPKSGLSYSFVTLSRI